MTKKAWAGILSTLFGLVVILAYLNFATDTMSLPDRMALILAFAIGPAAIWGVLEINKTLKRTSHGMDLRVGTVFLIIAFAFLNLMLVVQQSVFIGFQDYLENATDETVYEFLRLILKGTNLVQLGIDVSFDIFYSLGLVLVSVAFLRHSRFGMILGIYGIVTGGLLLAFNLATFPVPPADAGLIDFGPFTGLFWLAAILGGFAGIRRRREAGEAKAR
jgi:MYXO-CTERM domain-containing protein